MDINSFFVFLLISIIIAVFVILVGNVFKKEHRKRIDKEQAQAPAKTPQKNVYIFEHISFFHFAILFLFLNAQFILIIPGIYLMRKNGRINDAHMELLFYVTITAIGYLLIVLFKGLKRDK